MSTNHQHFTIYKKILDIFLYFIFWLTFFQILRLFFAVYHYRKFDGVPFSESAQVLLYSLRPDISAICYIFILVIILLIANEFIRSKYIPKIIAYYSYVWLTIVTIISVADVQLYNEWGTKINKESLTFLSSPNEVFASIMSSPIILLLLTIIVFTTIGIIIYRRIFKLHLRFSISSNNNKIYINIIKKTFLYIVLFVLLVIGVRGGIQLAPMNPSFAYFSKHDILNNTAINPTWNLAYSIMEQPKNRDYYIHFTADEVDSLLDDYRPLNAKDTSSIFKFTDNPNVVLVIIESFTADLIESLGGIPHVTPNFESLIQGGLSFQNFYASGNRTYTSLPAILNGYPSLPADRVINYSYIYSKFPSLAHTFNEHGYHSSFYYGGETEFANIRSLVLESGFETLIDQRHFVDTLKNSKWGAHDHVVFERVLADVEKYPKPFFTTILTLSNHEPFEIPTEPTFKNDDNPKTLLIKNSAAYSDQSIGAFISEAAKRDWFDNTIFIFTADHGHHYAKHRINKKFPAMFHIPLVIYSKLLNDSYIGAKNTKFSSQIDIPAILFNQLHFNHSDFIWSKNVFNPSQNDYAYYGFVDGFGWLTKDNKIVYDNLAKELLLSSGNPSTVNNSLETGQAYLQALYQDFLNY